MKIIILAAGRGSRINTITKKTPKALIKLQNKPLLYYQLKVIKSAGIKEKDISLITGYKKNKFKKFKLKTFNNSKWRTTNMIYSLSKANKWLSKYNCIILYGDILYSSNAIRLLKNFKRKFCILNNKNWYKSWKKRFAKPLEDLESYKVDNKKFLTEIGKRENSLKNIKGQFMGIFKINPLNWKKMKLELNKNNYKMSTTELLNVLINNQKVKIKSIDYKNYWFEIDSYKDLKIAEKDFKV
tara:strand:- start:124 stop:846 length:723 start_codon:yes stop_codon:yes gene_type:complete